MYIAYYSIASLNMISCFIVRVKLRSLNLHVGYRLGSYMQLLYTHAHSILPHGSFENSCENSGLKPPPDVEVMYSAYHFSKTAFLTRGFEN